MNRYWILKNSETLEAMLTGLLSQAPDNSVIYNGEDYQLTIFDVYPNPTAVVEGYSEDNNALISAFSVAYPEFANMNYKLLQLDNLEGIKRDSTLADKGLKGEKKYRKDGLLIWSSEKKYWFQQDGYQGGFRRVTKLYNLNGDVIDSWENFYDLSADDKQFFLKEQRAFIFEYFKSQQPELFGFLYNFFSKEINDYIMADGENLKNTLIAAAQDHPEEIVRQTLSQVIPTQTEGVTTTVLQGIIDELV